MRHVKIIAALSVIACLTACNNTVGSETIQTTEPTANIAGETSCPFGDISEDTLLLMSPAYAPSLLKTEEDTVKTIANAFNSSEWEIIDNETPLPDGENYSVFVYNDGEPFKLTFYGDYTSDEYDIAEYEQNDTVKRYRISPDAFITVFNAANPKNPDGIANSLVSCEYENLSVEGVWLDS